MMPNRTMTLGISVCVAALVAAACSSGYPAEVRELMQAPVAPASDAIFNAVVYTNGQLASAPQTDDQWNRLRGHAEALQKSGATLMTLAPRDNPDGWERQSVALVESAGAALAAIETKSLDGVLDAGGRIYGTCTACHGAYMEAN